MDFRKPFRYTAIFEYVIPFKWVKTLFRSCRETVRDFGFNGVNLNIIITKFQIYRFSYYSLYDPNDSK